MSCSSQFNRFAILLGIASLAVVAVYPFMKRITDWPQFVSRPCLFLGRADGLGAPSSAISTARRSLLYAGSILWVIGYDTIYAHQDKEDDAIVGVRSTARLFGNTNEALAGRPLWRRAAASLPLAFATAEAPMPALAGLLAAGAHMARQIVDLDIDNPDQCLRLFKSNSVIGWLIFLGLIGGGAVDGAEAAGLSPVARDDLFAVDDQAQAEVAGPAAGQEARPARASTTRRLRRSLARQRADRGAERFFQRAGDAVGLDQQHRQPIGVGPGAPVGGDVVEIVGHQQRHRQHRIVVQQFQRDGDVAVLVLDGARGNAAKRVGRQHHRRRQAAFLEDAADDRAALVDGEGDVAEIVARRVASPPAADGMGRDACCVPPRLASVRCSSCRCLPVIPESRFPGSRGPVFPVSLWR